MSKKTLQVNELIPILFDKWIYRLDNNKKINAYLKHFPANANNQAQKYFTKCINEMYNDYNCFILANYTSDKCVISIATSIKDITDLNFNYSDFFIKSNLIKKIDLFNKTNLIKDIIE
jgi:hypothetical protein